MTQHVNFPNAFDFRFKADGHGDSGGGGWISLQEDYLITRESDCQRFGNVALRLPNHHDSGHRDVMSTTYPGVQKHMKAYRKRFHQFPLRFPRYGPQTKLEIAFEELWEGCTPPHPREQKANNWIYDATWKLIYHHVMLRRRGMLALWGAQKLGREIKASLKVDCT